MDCHSVTINISIPENLCIGEQPLAVDESRATPSTTTTSVKKEGEKVDENSTETGESAEGGKDGDAGETTSTAQESPASTTAGATTETSRPSSTSKSWTIPSSDLRFALYLAERNDNFVCVYAYVKEPRFAENNNNKIIIFVFP